jgi:hypothetical protein
LARGVTALQKRNLRNLCNLRILKLNFWDE